MKKKLIDSCRVRPYTSGAAIDRQNFGSAVLGLKVAAATGSPTAAALKLVLTESDASSGTFAAVSDKQALIGGLLDADGAVTMDIPVAGGEAQIGIDLTGCTTKASILQKIREYEADAAAAAAIIAPEG